jgi:1-acyl-sn-glycerol-3-phosphate acyltransferase
VANAAAIATPGPLLVVANHPNSFLDAIIIGSRFDSPVHFLARGDAFTKSWHNKLLRMLNMIPVYRLSEGRENLSLNNDAFAACRQILARGGTVLIFIEGICINSHELQPFKKGAARIAMENIALPGLQILPLGIAYSALRQTGSTVHINAGAAIPANSLLPYGDEARDYRYFNDTLQPILTTLIRQPESAPRSRDFLFWLLAPVAALGYLVHAPLYFLLRAVIKHKTRGTVFHDSVMFAALLVLYPLFLLLIIAGMIYFSLPVMLIIVTAMVFPLSAMLAVRFFSRRTG